jgi:hypothetical protein
MLYTNKTTQLMAFTLADGTEEGQEVMIGPGGQADLPSDNNYIKGLVGLGQLEAAPTPELIATSKSKNQQ